LMGLREQNYFGETKSTWIDFYMYNRFSDLLAEMAVKRSRISVSEIFRYFYWVLRWERPSIILGFRARFLSNSFCTAPSALCPTPYALRFFPCALRHYTLCFMLSTLSHSS
jgi:hypothetical protein